MNMISALWHMVPGDLWLALGLIAIIVISVIGSRIGVLPKKSVPYVATAVGGALVATILRRWLFRAELREFQEAKAEAERVGRELDAMKKEYPISQQKRDQAAAEYEAKIAAHRENVLLIDARTEARKKEIEAMSEKEQDQLIAEFVKRQGGQ